MRGFKTLFLIVFLVSGIFFHCEQKQQIKTERETKSDIISLWNGKDFEGWDFFLEDSLVDPLTVWSVKEGNLFCSGVPNGYIITEKQYMNYKMIVEWRWPEEPGNSGVLLHVQKPDRVWPKCIEAQLMSGNAGDFYLIGGTTIKEQQDPENRRVVKQADSSEMEPGEWNRYEITCNEDSIVLKVNDVLQNTASQASVTKGFIAFQSEGKPIEFRKIELYPLNE